MNCWRFRTLIPTYAVTFLVILFVICGAAKPVGAQTSLHERIDQAIEAPPAPPLAGLCTDSEFLRRIYLDLTGAVPSHAVAKAFLADTNPSKRIAVIDQLLGSPQFIRHMSATLDVMLMERRADKHVKQDEWAQYLQDSVAQNKPWNQLAREVLGADGSDEKIRAAARFYLDRDGEPNLLTRDVGRVFFGMDLACCQCHDHPLVDSYLQSDFYGISAFLSRGTMFTDKKKKVFYAEKPEGDVKFTSVFTKQQDETRPCLPGDFEISEPVFLKGDEYTVPPADGVRPIPKFSRRSVLAEAATNGSNRAFNRNIANRLWALMLGRGLVEPLDMHHLDNPASHPELLESLAAEMVVMKYDIRAFLRELALSRTYQRSFQIPIESTEKVLMPGDQLAALNSQYEQAAAAMKATGEGVTKVRADYDAARKAVTAVLAEITAANNALGGAQKASAVAAKALADAQQQLSSKRELSMLLTDAAAKAAEAVAKLAGDTEVAQAADKFKARAAQYMAEFAAAEKLVMEKTTAAKSSADALAVAKGAADQVVAKLQTDNQKTAETRQQLSAALQKLHADELAFQSTYVRLQRAKSLSEVGKVVAAAQASRKKATDLQTEIANGKQLVVSLTAKMPQLESAMVAARTAHEDAVKQLAEAQKQLHEKQQTVQVVVDAFAKADAAVQKLPQDTELKQASEIVKTRRDKLQAELTEMQKAMPPRESAAKTNAEQFAAAQQAFSNCKTQLEGLQKSLPEMETQLPSLLTQADVERAAMQVALNQATELWSQQFSVSSLEPLTPEQLTWSVLTVTGMVEQTRAAVEAELNKAMPIDPNAPPDAAKLAERARQIEQKTYDKLKAHVTAYTGLFGHAGGQPQRDFFATVDQALYFANAGVLQSWLNPNGENLLGRLGKLSESRQVAEELYITVLSRSPSTEEIGAVTNYLQARAMDRPVALQELAWSLITSNEFRFSY